MFDSVSWKEMFTIVAAVLGAVLGVMNTWNAMSQRRVRLRVTPARASLLPGGVLTDINEGKMGPLFCIEVTNLSAFPLTITEVGLTVGRTARGVRRGAIPVPKVMDGLPWPRRLEARESVSLYFHPETMRGGPYGRAYAQTACGSVGYGTSPALTQLTGLLGR
jgi:hypothetical protein